MHFQIDISLTIQRNHAQRVYVPTEPKVPNSIFDEYQFIQFIFEVKLFDKNYDADDRFC